MFQQQVLFVALMLIKEGKKDHKEKMKWTISKHTYQ